MVSLAFDVIIYKIPTQTTAVYGSPSSSATGGKMNRERQEENQVHHDLVNWAGLNFWSLVLRSLFFYIVKCNTGEKMSLWQFSQNLYISMQSTYDIFH